MDFLRVFCGNKVLLFQSCKQALDDPGSLFCCHGTREYHITRLQSFYSLLQDTCNRNKRKDYRKSVQKTRNLLKLGLSSNGTSLERPFLHSLLSLIYPKRTGHFMSLWLCYILLSPKLECKLQWCCGPVYSIHCYVLSTQNCGWSPR